MGRETKALDQKQNFLFRKYSFDSVEYNNYYVICIFSQIHEEGVEGSLNCISFLLNLFTQYLFNYVDKQLDNQNFGHNRNLVTQMLNELKCSNFDIFFPIDEHIISSEID